MLDRFKKIIGRMVSPAGSIAFAPGDHRVAAAALLVHVANIDGIVHASERQRLAGLLEQRFGLGPQATRDLIAAAEKRETEAGDMQEFVDLIRRKVDAEGKAKLVDMMWEMAYADGELHEFEENLIARVAALLGVPQTDARAR
jgi:uncharacterized tellurite resistance protein B-like protein